MNHPRRHQSPLRQLLEAESHHHLLTSLLVAGVTFAVLSGWLKFSVRLILSWDVFAIVSIGLALGGMLSRGVRHRVHDARNQDSGRVAIAGCMVSGALISLVGVGMLLSQAKNLVGAALISPVFLAAFTLASSWFLVHVLLAVHYTHLYYHARDEDTNESEPGLLFPGNSEPDFLDLAYFSLVIGMTFQVSDVQITSRSIRRTVLIHSLISFLFNTVIVAFSINLATTLL